MKKRVLLIGFFLCGIVLINLSSRFVEASVEISNDADNDGIDDDFELLNKRKINVEIFSNEATILSTRSKSESKDQIRTDIALGEDGIEFQMSYKSNLESDNELTYSINFHEIIEFVDLDFDGIYDPETDQNIQNFTLRDFSPIFYEKILINSESFLHHLSINTDSNNFSLEIYFAEEFTLVENSLLTPTQARVTIEIANFSYLNVSSQLALYTRLVSEGEFINQEITEDEDYGYAKNETGIITTINDYTSFFSWNDSATIDSVPEDIVVSEISPDEFVENAQKFYISYPRGNIIIHSTKAGIENILITDAFPFLAVLFLILAIAATSSVVTYSIYQRKKHKLPSKVEKRSRVAKPIAKIKSQETVKLFDSKLALKILEEEDAIYKLYTKGDINITAISTDFYETIENFDLTKSEKSEFIRELLSL
ncbi:MAG: hypothetical protein ACXABG_13235, partial [Promethearchaeota archaeon]